MKTEATWIEHQAVEKLSTDNLSAYLRGLPAKAKMALRGLVHMGHGRLSIRMPDGRTVLIEGRAEGPEATLILHNWNLAHRALTGGTIGVAESYIDGDWESPDVTAFLELFLVNVEVGDTLAGGARGIARVVELIRHWLRSNSRAQAKKNISAHYDLGNAFYSKWLDETMTYSSALYQDGANDLAGAQTAKYRALAQAAGLKAGDHVLEIGCGWGGFAEYAASEIGCRVTGLTISREQLAFARQRIEKAGLSDKVDLRFQDYRDETGRYDGVVSIEMFEAVGEKYWPTYFSKVRECLKPGGRAGLQIITIKPEAYQAYRANPDFIQRYVFPGGMLPTENHLNSLGEAAGLEMVGHRAFGPDYGRTLAEWRQRFWNAWEEIQPMGFDLRFKRLWEFYMYYCEAGFRSGHINVRQVVYS
ncbi:MAG: class I SAM-dependent methyltransferase [Hoeflea sp.]|nr:class I SAM-dependent methyltransferase [Hoeflea sp.]